MIRVCFCYDENSILAMEAVQQLVSSFPDLSFEAYREDFHGKERKKAFAVKNMFAARATPFCGIIKDDKIIKGFYSEAKQCTFELIREHLTGTYAHTEIPECEVSVNVCKQPVAKTDLWAQAMNQMKNSNSDNSEPNND